MATEPAGEGQDEERHDTDYAPKSTGGSKPGYVLSAWSLVMGAAALVLVISGLLLI
ncbi:MAG: hypothetical protein QE284_11795 [Rhizobium sp.]|nr:hypothetical protein [Rhizobium sp.]